MTPGRFDAAVVRRHLLALDDAIHTLRRHQGAPLERLRADREERWVVEHGLQLCAQNVLDLATHLSAGAGKDAGTYGAALGNLSEIGILTTDFAARLRDLAGFRNVIVHGYLDVDVEVVHRLLNERLEDFSEFARQVSAFVAAGSSE